jgi:Rne/Rng family ribonuclease
VTRRLLISASPGEIWAVLAENGRATLLRVLRPERPGRVGDVILGRLVALRPELPAALVEIGLERPAFLSAEDAPPPARLGELREGQAVVVQIITEARADKAAGVSLRPRLAGEFLDLVPTRPGIAAGRGLAAPARARLVAGLRDLVAPGEGAVLRGAAAEASSAGLAADLAALRRRWEAITAAKEGRVPPALLEAAAAPLETLLQEVATDAVEQIIVDERAAFANIRDWLHRHRAQLIESVALHRETAPLFEHESVDADVASALAPRVALAGGGALTIDIAAAATLIDVDSGGTAPRGAKAADAALAVNLAAAEEVARQIRLRNLAGPIVVDFIGMRARGHRDRVRDALAEALAGDAEMLGWTRLGHLELVRARRHASVTETLFEREAGGGLMKTPLTTAFEVLRRIDRLRDPGAAPSVRVHPEVAKALADDAAAARRALEARLGRAIAVIAEPGRARDSFDIGDGRAYL